MGCEYAESKSIVIDGHFLKSEREQDYTCDDNKPVNEREYYVCFVTLLHILNI